MSRKKPQNLYPVKDLTEANTVLAEIGALKRQIEQINAGLADDVDRLKADAEAKTAPLAARMSCLENGLLAFAEYNKDELFAGRRSRELTFGTLGYRRSSEIAAQPKHTMAMVLGKLEELGFEEAIRINKSVNKDTMRTWPDERLELVGARRVEKDSFWYELKEVEVEDAAS